MTIDDLGSASERGCFLPPFFLYLYITIGDPESNPARVHNNNNNNNNNDDGSSGGGGGDNDSSRSTFSTSRPILPFTVTPALDPSLFYLFLDQDGAKSSVSLLPISFLLFLSSSSPPSLYTASLLRFF